LNQGETLPFPVMGVRGTLQRAPEGQGPLPKVKLRRRDGNIQRRDICQNSGYELPKSRIDQGRWDSEETGSQINTVVQMQRVHHHGGLG
jgi:hypothetical protein